MPGVTGDLMLKDLLPDGFQGMGCMRKESLVRVTERVRALVSTDWSVLGLG